MSYNLITIPQNIQWEGYDDISSSNEYRTIKCTSYSIIETLRSDVYLINLPNRICLIDDNQKEILFDVKYQIKQINIKKYQNNLPNSFTVIRQIELWRDFLSNDTKGLVERIFKNHLSVLADAIITSDEQTASGRRFWANRILEAFNNNWKVYYWNENNKVALEISDAKHFKQKSNSLYGDDQKFKASRIIISPKALI